MFPPYPEFDGINDPHIFLDPLARKEIRKTFDEFLRSKEHRNPSNDETIQCTQHNLYDVDVYIKDIIEGTEHGTLRGPTYLYQLLRAYAVDAWFNRLQAVSDQLEDLHSRVFKLKNTDIHSAADTQGQQPTLRDEGLLNEEGLRGALLRYLSSLNSESRQLDLDLRVAEKRFGKGHECVLVLRNMQEKYAHVTCRMGYLLSQTEHRLEMKQSITQKALANIQIQESRKSIEQASTVKR